MLYISSDTLSGYTKSVAFSPCYLYNLFGFFSSRFTASADNRNDYN